MDLHGLLLGELYFTFNFELYIYKGELYSQLQQIAICNSSIYELKEKLSLYTHTQTHTHTQWEMYFCVFFKLNLTVKMYQS